MKHPSGDEDDEYSSLVSTLKDLKKGRNNEKVGPSLKEEKDDDFQEDDNQRVYASFLNQLSLPGVDNKDSIGFRIEALRVYLEQQLGDDIFIKAYKYLLDPPIEDDNNAEL